MRVGEQTMESYFEREVNVPVFRQDFRDLSDYWKRVEQIQKEKEYI